MNVTVEEAAGSGMKSIEHLANYRVFGDCSTGDTYSPEQRARLWCLGNAYDGVFPNDSRYFLRSPLPHSEYASDSLLQLTRDNVRLSNISPNVLDRFRLANRLSLRAIHDLHIHGNSFLAGCDGLVPGFCLHDELEWLTKAGFTPVQSLQTATVDPVPFLGREKSEGTVEIGKTSQPGFIRSGPDRRHSQHRRNFRCNHSKEGSQQTSTRADRLAALAHRG